MCGFKENLVLIGLLCVQTDKLGTLRIQTPSHPSHHPSWAFTWGINALGYRCEEMQERAARDTFLLQQYSVIFWTYTCICWPLGIFLWEGKTPIIIFSNVFRNFERFPITQGHRAMAYIFNKHKLSHPYTVEANAYDYLIWVQSVIHSVRNALVLKSPAQDPCT